MSYHHGHGGYHSGVHHTIHIGGRWHLIAPGVKVRGRVYYRHARGGTKRRRKGRRR